jgi:ribonuclease R
LVSRVDLDARKIEFSLVKSVGLEPGGTTNRRQIILASDTGRPNKKAAPKKGRPGSKEPQKHSGVNVNAAKSAGNLGANQSKNQAGRTASKVAKSGKPTRPAGKPAGTKPPVRITKARRK